MKTLKNTTLATIVILVGAASAQAQGCQPMRKNALGTVVAPFCDPYGREKARQEREHGVRYQGPRIREVVQFQINQRRVRHSYQAPAAPRVQYIPQPQPTASARRCVVNGVPGWCD